MPSLCARYCSGTNTAPLAHRASSIAIVSGEATPYIEPKVLCIPGHVLGFPTLAQPVSPKQHPNSSKNPFPCPVVAVDDHSINYDGDDERFRVLVKVCYGAADEMPLFQDLKTRITECIAFQRDK